MLNANHARSALHLGWVLAVCVVMLASPLPALEADQVLISGYPYRYHSTGKGELFNKQGRFLLRLDDLFLGMVQLDKVVGHELFWIAGPIQNEGDSGYKFELRVTDLKSKETKTIWSDDQLSFKVNKKGSIVAVSHDTYENSPEGLSGRSKITIIDRKSGQNTEIFDDFLAVFGLNQPFCWSSDGSMLWAGYGLGDNYDELILYRKGQVSTFEQTFGRDFIIDCDRGWIAYSDYPVVAPEGEDAAASQVTMSLWLHDVLKQKRIKVASTALSEDGFRQKWVKTSSGALRLAYSLGNRKKLVDPARLLKPHKSGKTRHRHNH